MTDRTVPRFLALVLACSAAATPARAQQRPPDSSPLTSTLDLGALRDLPSTGTLFSLLETTQPEVVSDRFFGGVNPAEPARLGVFLTSWTQTTFLVDGVDITSADRGGPLFVPPVSVWQGVRVSSGAIQADVSGPGLLVSLEPLRPPSDWQVSAEGSGSGSPLVGRDGRLAPPIARPAGWASATAAVGGPVVAGRLGLLVSASMTRASQFDRGSATESEHAVDSIFSHLVFTLGGADEVRTIGWRQVTRYPGSHGVPSAGRGSDRREASTHAQSTWQRGGSADARWRIFGAVTERVWDVSSGVPALQVIERLVDGPVAALVGPPSGRERRWSAGWRTAGIGARTLGLQHAIQAGADASHVSSRAGPAPAVTVGELVGGIPARIWSYSASAETLRTRVGLAAFVADTVRLSEDVTMQGGLRVDRVAGTARGARQGIAWHTVLPRLSARWQIGRAALHAGATGTAESLLTDVLAYGDPGAAVADVRRWDGSREGPLVARAGPGAGTDGSLTTIDPTIERPITREFLAGIETAFPRVARVRVTAISRRRSHQVALVNVGVPASAYGLFHVADPGPNFLDPVDDQLLPIYNRLPGTFGQDRYLLSNSDQPATFRGLTLIADRTSPRLFLVVGLAAGWTDAAAGYRGYGPAENDAGIVGELATDPNAATHARGNLFADRQYTGRIAAVYRFTHDVTVGAVARYQDGQAFSRMVVAPGLNQGTDAIRAFRSGKSRFTFTGTLDLRVQKGLALPGGGRAVLLVDGYNVLNLDKEVEEWVVTGPAFRTPTAAQPPRAIHLGLRLSF
ncbi:MAG: hypothetical protein EXQ53_08615 [Acidobacteria bacterium]|nr:hypothetical protein [Acidobacteriota bacterium]